VFFNLVGGSLTLLSIQLPWVVVNGSFPFSVQQDGLYAVALYWILAGATLSFVSRYGGLMTLVGMLAFAGEPYISSGYFRAGEGVLLAALGAFLTFAGTRWSIPRDLVKRREVIGGVLYTVGFLVILTIAVSWFVYDGILLVGDQLIVEAPLLLVGVFLTGVGLKLFLSPERRENSLSVLTTAA
jgi:hypothetical protein